ncbi:hypothetical protein [Bradyrhizobium sp. 23AC]
MPAFTFEKITPPVHRAPTAAAAKKPRGVMRQMIDRIAERRARRTLQDEPPMRRDEKPAE